MIIEYLVFSSSEHFVKWQQDNDVCIISTQAIQAHTFGSETECDTLSNKISLTHSVSIFVTFTRGVKK